jgi:hypothetical protein
MWLYTIKPSNIAIRALSAFLRILKMVDFILLIAGRGST